MEMDREEQIQKFYQRYYDNEISIRKLDNQLFTPGISAEEWAKCLTERSDEIRRAYKENIEGVQRVLTPIIEGKITSNEAEALLREISKRNMYITRDFMMNRPVLESLIDYYREMGDEVRVKQVYGLIGNCYVTSLLEEEYREEFDDQKKAIFNFKDFNSYNSMIQESAIKENYNAFVIQCVLTSVPYETIMESGQNLIAFLESDEVKKASEDFKSVKINEFIYLSKMNLVEAYYGKPVPKTDTIERIRRYAAELMKMEESKDDVTLLVFSEYWDYLAHIISGNEFFEELYKMYFSQDENGSYVEGVSFVEDSAEMPPSFYIAGDVVHALRYTDYTEQKQAKLYKEIIDKFIDDINRAKKGRFDIILSDYIQRFIYSLDAYCGPKEVLLEAIVNISIRQQIQTYLHTIMVKNIALIIAEDAMERHPEVFIGYQGYQMSEDIIAHQKDILEYVRCSALLHDIGKIRISEIINLQSRKLTEREFDEIKRHPEYGERLIKRFPCLKEYADVVEGHHKSFDGKSGYPKGVNNTESPYKVIIDLITIADSIDAATDILGRNYTEGKDFNHVLEELIQDKGTRYSDVWVDYIDSREGLKEQLSRLTSSRSEIYREVYANIVEKVV